MTIPFLKLHVAGHDFILIDQDNLVSERTDYKPAHREVAELILDRRCGVGGDGCIFMISEKKQPGLKPTLIGRLFASDGRELPLSPDALLCIARLAMDTGRSNAGTLVIENTISERTYELTAIDSRSFLLPLPYPAVQPLTLIVDGRSAWAYRISMQTSYLVAGAVPGGPGAKRVRQALLAMEKTNDIPLVLRQHTKDIIRYVGPERTDRMESAVAAVLAAGFQGFVSDSGIPGLEGAIVAEWRGRGGAVSYASFPATPTTSQTSGPSTLIDRGRFWVNPDRNLGIQVVGKAEYVFDGNFDL
ncbi:hypothetical protein [Gracilinema caldarium]|uniref:hypothetical protein n=1 Tax=Gracilinema caldarium TaxID=215591 RepID=UPI0026F20E34|nr:hypothetical protein [Gracilinema caldarium]